MRTRRVALLGAAIAIATATGSIGWAAIGDGGTVRGCVANNGTIDAIDPITQACRDRQTPVEWYTKAGADAAFVNSGEPTEVSGHQAILLGAGPIAAGDTVTFAIPCPAGKVATGGGFFRADRSLEVMMSRPSLSDEPPGWKVTLYNPTATAQQGYAGYVVCVNG